MKPISKIKIKNNSFIIVYEDGVAQAAVHRQLYLVTYCSIGLEFQEIGILFFDGLMALHPLVEEETLIFDASNFYEEEWLNITEKRPVSFDEAMVFLEQQIFRKLD